MKAMSSAEKGLMVMQTVTYGRLCLSIWVTTATARRLVILYLCTSLHYTVTFCTGYT